MAETTLTALRGRAADRLEAATRAAARLSLAESLLEAVAEKTDALKGLASADVVAKAFTEESVARLGASASRRALYGATVAARAAAARTHGTELKIQHRQHCTLAHEQRRIDIHNRQTRWAHEAAVRHEQNRRWADRCVRDAADAATWERKLQERHARERRAQLASAHRKSEEAANRAAAVRARAARFASATTRRADTDGDGVLSAEEFRQLEATVAGDGRLDAGDFVRAARAA